MLRRFTVEYHAKSVGRGRQQVAILPLGLHGDDVGEERPWFVGLLLDAEVGAREVQVQAGGRRDGPRRVVDGEIYVVSFAHGGDLLRLSEAAGEAQVDAGVVYPLLLHQLPEIPLGAELLPGGQGYGGTQPQHLVGAGILGTQRVLDKEGPQGLGLATEPQGVGHVQSGVNVEYHLDLFAHGIPYRRELLDGGAHGTIGLEDLTLLGQTPAYEAPPRFSGPQTRFDEGRGVRTGFHVVRVADHPVAGPSAEQLVDGDPEGLPLDIPQRNVHGRERRRSGVPGGEEASPKEQLPEVLRTKR